MKTRAAGSAAVVMLGVLAIGTPAAAQNGRAGGNADVKTSRAAVIARAQVWHPVDIREMDLRTGPTGPGSFAPGATITCDYSDKKLSGASPKFVCVLPGGEELKVKYGGSNGEVYAEVMASRLLWALGFGADRMYSVRVICRGCPEPIGSIRRDNGDRIVDPAAVERKFGRELSDHWSWDELALVHEGAGGAPKAHRDALTLLAAMLQHSDSKAEQQRIVCVDEPAGEGDACASPLMMIGDVGITFGRGNWLNLQPRGSAHLAEWMSIPVWKDGQGCIANLPGSATGTLKYPLISEAGRKFLAGLLAQLSDQQLRDMFEAARVTLRPRAPESGRSGFATVDEWLSAFKQKRDAITNWHCAS